MIADPETDDTLSGMRKQQPVVLRRLGPCSVVQVFSLYSALGVIILIREAFKQKKFNIWQTSLDPSSGDQ